MYLKSRSLFFGIKYDFIGLVIFLSLIMLKKSFLISFVLFLFLAGCSGTLVEQKGTEPAIVSPVEPVAPVVPQVPSTKGPDGPPSVQGPSGKTITPTSPQAVMEKEEVQYTLPQEN